MTTDMDGRTMNAPKGSACDAPSDDLTHAHPCQPDRSKPAVTVTATPDIPASPLGVSRRVRVGA